VLGTAGHILGGKISLGVLITTDLDLKHAKRDTVIYFERSKIKDSQNMRGKRRRINLRFTL